jgi:plastocyanin
VKRTLPAIALACATLVVAGCGSSGSGPMASSGAETTSTGGPSEGPNPEGSHAGETGYTGTTGTTKTTGASSTSTSPGLQPDTTPKFARASGPVRSGVVNIAYRNIAIAPDTVRVKLGSTIKWTNYDPIPHNVTSEGGVAKFASKNFGEGGTFEFTVTKPGLIHYENTLQPTTMNGTIEVVQ